MKINVNSYNVKGYLPFSYVKGEGIDIGVPARFFVGGATIYIKDGNLTFEPKAVENEIPEQFGGLVAFASDIFSPEFFKQFENCAAGQKGKKITYIANGIELILNSDTGLVEKITKDDVSLEPVKYKQFSGSKIPHVINVSSKKYKFKGSFEAANVSAADKHAQKPADISEGKSEKETKNENNDTSPGKN
jgi:hypothetical protein